MTEENKTPETAPSTPETADGISVETPEAEASRYKDLALRTAADFDNFRKRAAREKEEAIRFANTSLLEKLLPVLDNFELGLEAAKTATDASAIAEGMSMVHRQLVDFLKAHNVDTVPAEGEKFDPTIHEAVAQEHHDDIAEGHIVRQLRKGYKLKDRLIRASTVTVSKGKAG